MLQFRRWLNQNRKPNYRLIIILLVLLLIILKLIDRTFIIIHL